MKREGTKNQRTVKLRNVTVKLQGTKNRPSSYENLEECVLETINQSSSSSDGEDELKVEL